MQKRSDLGRGHPVVLELQSLSNPCRSTKVVRKITRVEMRLQIKVQVQVPYRAQLQDLEAGVDMRVFPQQLIFTYVWSRVV